MLDLLTDPQIWMAGARVPVVHTVGVLDWATGKPVQESLPIEPTL